jgi:hypothetical protein
MIVYNLNGTVSEVIVNAIVEGKVTSSIATAPTIVTASATGDVNTQNFASANQTYLSSATPTPVAFGAVSANSASMAKYPSRKESNFSSSYITPLTIPGDKSLSDVIDSRVLANIDFTGGTVNPNLKTIKATQFATTYSTGTVLVVGDDTWIKDSNLANGFNVVGQQQNYRGFFKFGTNGPVVGHNGNNATLPTPGDGQYALTGSLIVSASKLMFYNGLSSGTNGWTAII